MHSTFKTRKQYFWIIVGGVAILDRVMLNQQCPRTRRFGDARWVHAHFVRMTPLSRF